MRLTAALFLLLLAAPLQAQEPHLYIGGMAHGRPNIDALAELELGNFIWIPPTYYWESGNIPWNAEHDLAADIDACLDHDFHFMIGQRRGVGDAVRHGGFEYGGHGSGDIYGATETAAILQQGGSHFLGFHAEEMDADMVQNAVRPTFRARTPHLFEYTDRRGGRLSFEGELARLQDRYHSWGADFWPNLIITHHLSGFRIEPERVMAEFLEHLPTTELQLAYLRGGSQQFGIPWGVWVSPWFWGTIPNADPDYWTSPRATAGGGHSTASFRKCLQLAYVSGATVLTAQETEPLYGMDAHGEPFLGDWGRELKQLWDYAKTRPEPMQPIVSLAVMLDEDQGWQPKHLWQNWLEKNYNWGKLPVDRGDAMLPAFFDVLLPGFERTAESVRAREDIYPGYFAGTPAGPFDIVASDIDAIRLAKYPVVLLLGDVDMTPELRGALRSYVEHGGTLVLNALHMRDGDTFVHDTDLTGVAFNVGGTYSRIWSSNRIQLTAPIDGLPNQVDEPWFISVDVQPAPGSGTEILATDHEGHPVLLRYRLGDGKVYVTTSEYMLEGHGEQTRRLNFFAEWIPTLTGAAPLRVDGPSGLSWVAAQQGEDVVMAIANHAATPAEATVEWDGPHVRALLDLGAGAVQSEVAAGTLTARVSIPADDVVLVRMKRTAQSNLAVD